LTEALIGDEVIYGSNARSFLLANWVDTENQAEPRREFIRERCYRTLTSAEELRERALARRLNRLGNARFVQKFRYASCYREDDADANEASLPGKTLCIIGVFFLVKSSR